MLYDSQAITIPAIEFQIHLIISRTSDVTVILGYCQSWKNINLEICENGLFPELGISYLKWTSARYWSWVVDFCIDLPFIAEKSQNCAWIDSWRTPWRPDRFCYPQVTYLCWLVAFILKMWVSFIIMLIGIPGDDRNENSMLNWLHPILLINTIIASSKWPIFSIVKCTSGIKVGLIMQCKDSVSTNY